MPAKLTFAANSVWLRMYVLVDTLLSAFKRVGLPAEMHHARPKRLRFLVRHAVGQVVGHARETLLYCVDAVARALADAPRVAWPLVRPALAGE